MLLKILSHIRCFYLISSLIILTVIITYIDFEHYSFFKLKESCLIINETSKVNSSYVQRAILVYYPSHQEVVYLPEIRWLYRSWIEMIKYESNQWRTDLIIFTEEYTLSLKELDCIVNQIRQNHNEQPTCRVILYLRLSLREIYLLTKQQKLFVDESSKKFFHINFQRSILLYEQIRTYQYIDSINILAESYPIYSYYNFILKTDLDIFLTKQFSKFLPNTSTTLFFGRGGYSTEFNTRRLGRIAKDMNWTYQNLTNIGSTWYGSPYIAYRIANLTLDAMLYLSQNEFTRVEREQKLAVLLWPDWHYGVLSMYGTHLAVNHLKTLDKLDITNGDQLLDQPTTDSNQNDIEINNRLHLHCWHTDEQFSKFQFKANKYNHIDPHILINDSSPKGYAMRMALESRLMTLNELGQYLRVVSSKKILSSSTTFPNH